MGMVTDKPAWSKPLLRSPHKVADKAQRVRGMFNEIAPRYELVNRLFSGGRDAYWRRQAVNLARVRADDDVLDIACGTGDFARTFASASPRSIIGTDFAHEMLSRAAGRGDNRIRWVESDALHLPFADHSFSIVSCAFGVRNFVDLDKGLAEMARVLRPGGRAIILEFTRPTNLMFRRAYELYANYIMPIGASWISRDRSGAYRYLPRSVVSFLDAEEMVNRLDQSGFSNCQAKHLTMGVVTIYLAQMHE